MSLHSVPSGRNDSNCRVGPGPVSGAQAIRDSLCREPKQAMSPHRHLTAPAHKPGCTIGQE
eukprot:11158628-Lingulodinium_polyedra.AAC.1